MQPPVTYRTARFEFIPSLSLWLMTLDRPRNLCARRPLVLDACTPSFPLQFSALRFLRRKIQQIQTLVLRKRALSSCPAKKCTANNELSFKSSNSKFDLVLQLLAQGLSSFSRSWQQAVHDPHEQDMSRSNPPTSNNSETRMEKQTFQHCHRLPVRRARREQSSTFLVLHVRPPNTKVAPRAHCGRDRNCTLHQHVHFARLTCSILDGPPQTPTSDHHTCKNLGNHNIISSELRDGSFWTHILPAWLLAEIRHKNKELMLLRVATYHACNACPSSVSPLPLPSIHSMFWRLSSPMRFPSVSVLLVGWTRTRI